MFMQTIFLESINKYKMRQNNKVKYFFCSFFKKDLILTYTTHGYLIIFNAIQKSIKHEIYKI